MSWQPDDREHHENRADQVGTIIGYAIMAGLSLTFAWQIARAIL